MASSGLSHVRLARMHDVLERKVAEGVAPGVITGLARRGEVHVDAIGSRDIASGAPMQRDTIVRIASMTKPVIAIAVLILVEETVLRLDDPVDPWLPELADRRVLRRIDSPLDDTEPAVRPITLRDLLTSLPGFGMIAAPAGTYPIQEAMTAAGLDPGATAPDVTAEAWLAGLAAVPSVAQPGERWMYHTAYDVLGILVERAAGANLETFLRERIFDPLGMRDTGFSVPPEKLDRLATAYERKNGEPVVFDEAHGSRWASPPTFRAGGGGLVSTVDDYLAFGRMLLEGGRCDGGRIVSRPTVRLMTTDQITATQKDASPFFPGFWESTGWGFGVGIPTRRASAAATPGSYGWDGGLGTLWQNDPDEELVLVALTQLTDFTGGPDIRPDVRTLAYAAIDD